jgi:adenine-specific DNA-methyltransferase
MNASTPLAQQAKDQSKLFVGERQPDREVTNKSDSLSERELADTINMALAESDHRRFVDALGNFARQRGMSQIARDTGLARKSLYRALSSEGNPEFSTILRVIAAVGLRLEASKVRSSK